MLEVLVVLSFRRHSNYRLLFQVVLLVEIVQERMLIDLPFQIMLTMNVEKSDNLIVICVHTKHPGKSLYKDTWYLGTKLINPP